MSDYRAVNKQIEKVPGVIPNQGAEIADLRGAICFGKIDMLQEDWQMSLAPEGLFTPTLVPQGILNATAYFQGVGDDRVVGRLELQGLG